MAGVAALSLAVTTTFGWAWGFEVDLAAIWLASSGIAFYAIRHRQVSAHQEWMRRSYIVTFAFVSFHLLTDYLQPNHDVFITSAWVSWVVPMAVVEAVVQLRKLCQSAPDQS